VNDDWTIGHGKKLPYTRGTLVEDPQTGRRGHLMGVLVETHRQTGRVRSQEAFVRPEGGGCEWSAPADRIKAVEVGARSAPISRTKSTV
jgi:hypothetical protein